MLGRLMSLLTIVAASTSAIAQSNFNCDTIITNGLREYNISSANANYLNTVFSRYCYADGRVNSSSLNIGLSAVIQAIPIKFTLGSSDANQAMTNFCSNYSSSTESQSSTNQYQETIVRRAYDSYDACVRLSSLGLYVTHDIITDEKAQILLRAGVGKPIEVNGVDTSNNISCAGPDGSGKEVSYTDATHRQSTDTIGVFCTRKSRSGPGGVTVYDEGSVAIDITGDKYNFYWPKSEILPEDVASRVQTSIAELRTSSLAQGAWISAFGGGRLLAIADVSDSKLSSHSDGVAFAIPPNADFGKLSFPNPKHLIFVPVISEAKNAGYITNLHFVREIGPDYINVVQKALDTGGRTYPPCCFTAAIIGFDSTPK